MAKPKFVPPIYIYVCRKQTGFNEFHTGLIAVDEDNQIIGTKYRRFSPESAKDLYERMTSPDKNVAQEAGEIRVHCRGEQTSLTLETFTDGYFGRPKIIHSRELFLRRLTRPERDYLQKHFNGQKGKVRLTIVD